MTPDQNDRLKNVEIDIRALRTDMNKLKGFIAGVVFIIHAVWAGIVLFIRSQT